MALAHPPSATLLWFCFSRFVVSSINEKVCAGLIPCSIVKIVLPFCLEMFGNKD